MTDDKRRYEFVIEIPLPRRGLGWRGWAKFLYALLCLILLLASAALILFTFAGCAAAPTQSVPISPTITPTATAAPTISAGDFADLKVTVRQLQETLTIIKTSIRTSYALDAERAKLEAQKQRDKRLASAADTAMWLGFVLLMLALPAPPGEKLKALIVVLSVSLIAGSQAVPMLWPF